MAAKKRMPFKPKLATKKFSNHPPAKSVGASKTVVSEISSLEEYMHFIEQNCDADYILFRGQNTNWPLLPKLSRITFRSADMLNTEKEIIEDFKRLCKPHVSRVPQNEWEWVALAQHHGAPTRLLDWSANPLAALWFAVNEPCTGEYGVVWVFVAERNLFLKPEQISKTSPFTENKARVFQPEISTIRIQAQSGWFTTQQYHGVLKKFIELDQIPAYKKCLFRLQVPASAFSSLRFQLDRLGINRFSLFQDLDGVAGYVLWSHSIIADETEKENSKKSFGNSGLSKK